MSGLPVYDVALSESALSNPNAASPLGQAAFSVVDTCVAVAAESAAAGGEPVEILTSDSSYMAALGALLAGRFETSRVIRRASVSTVSGRATA